MLSPERDSKRTAGPSQARAESTSSGSLDFLSGLAAKAALALPDVSDPAETSVSQPALVGAVTKQAAATGIDGIRKIVIPPPPIPVDMPPLRR